MDSPNSHLEQRVGTLETSQNLLRVFCLIEAVVLAAVGALAFLTGHVHASRSSDILYARGLVIEDTQGRARALLGAPFPRVPSRKRQIQCARVLE